jgi:hypothetical protein
MIRGHAGTFSVALVLALHAAWATSEDQSSERVGGDTECVELLADETARLKVNLIQKKVEQHRHSVAEKNENGPARRTKALASCTGKWGIFPKDPLNRSLVQPSSSHDTLQDFTDFTHFGKKNFTGLFASPAHRFAFCSIAKVSSSAWANIFMKLHFNDPSAEYVDGQPYFSTSHEDMAAVFSDPGATTAVAVREPLARFVSTFLNKCNVSDKSLHWRFAEVCPLEKSSNVSMKNLVEWMLSQDPAHVEFHWLLQSEYCQLRDRIQSYDYVLHYGKETFGPDSACLMEKAGLVRFNTNGPKTNWSDFWTVGASSCREEEEELGNEPTTTSCTEDAEVEMLKLLLPPEVAKLLMAHFRQDYVTFNIPEPDWLSQALGILYDTPFVELDSARDNWIQNEKMRLRSGDQVTQHTTLNTSLLGSIKGKQVYAMSHPYAWYDFAKQYFPLMHKVAVPNNTDACAEWLKVCIDDGYAMTEDECMTDSERFQIHVVGAYMREAGIKSLEETEMDFTRAMGDMTTYDPYFEYNVGLFTLDLDHFVSVFDNDSIPYFASTFMGENGKTYYSVLVQMPGSLALGAKSLNNMEFVAESSQLLPAKPRLYSCTVPRASQHSLEHAKKYLLDAPRQLSLDGKTPVLAFLHMSFASSDLDRDFEYFHTVLYGTTTSLLNGTVFTGHAGNGTTKFPETFAFRHVQTEGFTATKGPVSVKGWESYQSGLHTKCFDVANNDGFDRLADNHYGHVVDDLAPYVKAHLKYGLPQRFYYGGEGFLFYYMYFPNGWGTELIGPCHDASVCPEIHPEQGYSFCTQGITGHCRNDLPQIEETVVACRRRRGTEAADMAEPDPLSPAHDCDT